MKASEWIDRVKVAREWETDYRVAKELELSRQTISTYRSRPDVTMDEETSLKVAKALGEPAEVVLLDQAAERARSHEARSALSGLLQRLQRGNAGPGGGGKGRLDISLVTLIALAATMLSVPQPSQAYPNASDSGIRIASNRRQRRSLLAALARAWRDLCQPLPALAG